MRTGICLILAIALAATSAYAAKVKPISELTGFPENDEEYTLWQLAGEHEADIEKNKRRYHNPEVEAYVKTIVMKMIGSRLDHVNVDIEIILIREPTLSAWVYPYGDIAVHTGLLAGMENEAQLAAILGHEVSHFLHRHSYRELIVENQQSAFGKGLGFLVSAAVAAETGRMPTNLMSGVGNFWTGLVTNGYSRKLEHAADEGGLELMAGANYDRAQALLAFEALKQNDVYGTVDVSTLWSSHPTLEDRLKNLEKNIKREARNKNYQPGTVPEGRAYDEAIAPVLLFNASIDLRERYYDRAQTALERYLAVRQEPMAEYLLGESIRKANPDGPDFSARLAAYNRSITLDENFAPAHKERGMALRQQGNTREASAEFRRYLRLAPGAADAGIIRGYMTDME